MGLRPTKVDEEPSGADPQVRVGPPGPALWRSITFPAGRRGRRLRTRGSALLGVFNGAGAVTNSPCVRLARRRIQILIGFLGICDPHFRAVPFEALTRKALRQTTQQKRFRDWT